MERLPPPDTTTRVQTQPSTKKLNHKRFPCSAEEHRVTHFLMQTGQLLDGDDAHRSMPVVAGGLLQHLIKLYELANLSSSEMCIADASNCRQAKQENLKQRIWYTKATGDVDNTKGNASETKKTKKGKVNNWENQEQQMEAKFFN